LIKKCYLWIFKYSGWNNEDKIIFTQQQHYDGLNWKNRAKSGKIEPNQKKLSQNKKTKSNLFEPVFVLKNRIEPNRNRLVWTGFGYLKKKYDFVIFLIKTKPNRKWSPLNIIMICFFCSIACYTMKCCSSITVDWGEWEWKLNMISFLRKKKNPFPSLQREIYKENIRIEIR
jgi:hypothetical protein